MASLFSRRAEPARGRVLVASARQIDLGDRAERERLSRARIEDWQSDAWFYYDQLGEAHYAANWQANAVAKVEFVSQYEAEPDEWVALADAEISDSERELAAASLDRLEGAEGGQGALIRPIAANLFVGGDAYLIASAPDGIETWEVVGPQAIHAAADRISISRHPNRNEPTARQELDPDAFMLRIWHRHPAWPDMPDAPMRGAVQHCRDLLILTRMIQALAQSRIPAGILAVAQELSFGPTDPTQDPNQTRSEMVEALMKHLTQPISDPADVAAIVPFILELPKDYVTDGINYLNLDRPIDELSLRLRDEARKSFAAVVDLPADILSGMGDVNHWGQWAIAEEAFEMHVEPKVIAIANALTAGYYRPALAGGVDDARRHRIGYDPSALISRPAESKNALEGHDRFIVSDAAARRMLKIPDDAAPDDAERERRLEEMRVRKGRSAGDAPPGTDTAPGPPEGAAALLAAATDDPALGLARDLATIEAALLSRLRTEADRVVGRTLERAGNRLRSAANGDATLRGMLDTVAPIDVARTLGPAAIRTTLALSEDDLLDDLGSDLRGRYDSLSRAAQRDALAAVAARSGLAIDGAAYEARSKDNRDEGWAALIAGLTAAAAALLYDPRPRAPELGEWDDLALVGADVIRQALSTAGGGPSGASAALSSAGSEVAGGLVTGADLVAMIVESGASVIGRGYVWVYGDALRSQPFEPHRARDGVTFEDFTDPVLANTLGGFPGPYYYPSDHRGCLCTYARILAIEED